MSGLAPDQRVLLAGIGGWSLVDCLLEPDHGIPAWKSTQAGGTWVYSTPWDWGHTMWQLGPKRITVGRFTRDAEPLASVTWTELRRITLPLDMRVALTAIRDDGRQINREGFDDPYPYWGSVKEMAAHQARWQVRHERYTRWRTGQQAMLGYLLGVVRTPAPGGCMMLRPAETVATAASPEPVELALFDLAAVGA
ncbi:hypothetical protein GCM10027047_01430 [Rhodococcus aerolatus]